MSYKDYLTAITQQLRKSLGTGFRLELHQVLKNNGIILDGLLIERSGETVIPTLYLMPYYERYIQHRELSRSVQELLTDYKEKSGDWKEEFDYSFDTRKDTILYRVVHYQKNQELLKTLPHDLILDLAVTYHCLVKNEENDIGTIQITKEHLQKWKVGIEEIRQLAMKNTPNLFPAEISSMSDVLSELFESQEVKSKKKTISHEENRIYILTNQRGLNGASCILYPEVLEQFAEQIGKDFYILPSSIHEVLLVPLIPGTDIADMSEMVSDINQSQVPEEEVLSNQAYLYSEIKSELKQFEKQFK